MFVQPHTFIMHAHFRVLILTICVKLSRGATSLYELYHEYPKGRVFAPFWSENGYTLRPFWSGIAYGFQGTTGVYEHIYLLSQGRPGGVVVYKYTRKKFAKIPQNTQNSSKYTQNYTQVYFIPEIQRKCYTEYLYLSCNIPYTRFKKPLYIVYPKTLADPAQFQMSNVKMTGPSKRVTQAQSNTCL